MHDGGVPALQRSGKTLSTALCGDRGAAHLDPGASRSPGYQACADVRDVFVLLMIPVDPCVRRAGRRGRRRRGGYGVRVEAGWCVVASLAEHPGRTTRTLF